MGGDFLTGDEVRASIGQRVNWEERVLTFLRDHGPSTTSRIRMMAVRTGGMEYRSFVDMLAAMLDAEKLVARRQSKQESGGRPGIVWSIREG